MYIAIHTWQTKCTFVYCSSCNAKFYIFDILAVILILDPSKIYQKVLSLSISIIIQCPKHSITIQSLKPSTLGNQYSIYKTFYTRPALFKVLSLPHYTTNIQSLKPSTLCHHYARFKTFHTRPPVLKV